MGDFGGFNSVRTRWIEDKYGDEYEVPDELFDGGDDAMARAYVERAREQRQAEPPNKPRNPYVPQYNTQEGPLDNPYAMSDFMRSGLNYGERLNENLNPLMLAGPLGLKKDWDEGRFVGSSLTQMAPVTDSPIGLALPKPLIEMGKGLWDSHQKTFQQGMGELSEPFDPTNFDDYGTKAVGGLRTMASVIPFLGPALSDSMNMARSGDWSGSLGSATGIGLGMASPRLKGHFDDWRAAGKVHTPDMAISDPSAMPIEYPPGSFPVEYGPNSPMQGTYVPRGTSASTVPERFPNLTSMLDQDLHGPERPPAGTWAERMARMETLQSQGELSPIRRQQARFADYENRAAEGLADPNAAMKTDPQFGLIPESVFPGGYQSPNRTVFDALLPDSVKGPDVTPDVIPGQVMPGGFQRQTPNLGIRDPTYPDTTRTYGLRPSGSTIGDMPEPIMAEPNPQVRPNAGLADPVPANTRFREPDLTDPTNQLPDYRQEMTEPGQAPNIFEKNPSWERLQELQKGGYVEQMTHPDGVTAFKHDPKRAGEMGKAIETINKTSPERKTPDMIDRNPVTSSARSLYRWLIGESGEATLNRMGEGGKNLSIATQQSTADSFGFSGKQTNAMTQALRPFKGKAKRQAALQQMVDHVERGTNSNNRDLQALIEAYRAADRTGTKLYKDYDMQVEDTATGKSRPFEERENYWHHKWTKDEVSKNRTEILKAMTEPDKETGKAMTLEQAEMALEKGKTGGYGFLDELKTRRSDLKGYRVDEDVYKGHWIDMARKAYNDKIFGQITDPDSFVSQQLKRIGEEYGPQARIQAEQIMQRYLSKELPSYDATLVGQASSAMSRFEAITKLGMSTVGNMLGGTAMVGSRTRMTNMAKAFKDSMTTAGRDWAEQAGTIGSLWRDSAADVGYGSDVSKIYGIAGTEKHLRTFSGLAGKHEANTLFKEIKQGGFRSENKMKQLQDLILEPDMKKVMQQTELSPSQIDRAANRMTDLTQGRADVMSLPRAWTHPNPMVNLVTQFKKYAYIHSKNLKDAMKRNPMAAPRLLALMVASGEGNAYIKSLLSGKQRPEEWDDRVFDDLANSYGAGYLGELWTSATQDTWQEGLGRLAPPIASDAMKFLTAGGKTVESMYDEEGDFNLEGLDTSPLQEEVAGWTPIIGNQWKRSMREANKE